MKPSFSHRPRSGKRQAGIAALGIASLMLLLSGILLGSAYLARRAADPQANLQAQQETLDTAEKLLNSFASVYGRLPCPAKEKDGSEDCRGGRQKGWLPVQALERFRVTTAGRKPWLDVRYVVYRGAGMAATPPDPDLGSAVDDVYRPELAASGSFVPPYPPILGKEVEGTPVPVTIKNGVDFCGKLRALISGPRWRLAPRLSGASRSDRAHTSLAGGGMRNIAYGLAVAGANAGGSGINANIGLPQLEAPDRPHNAHYTDLVRVVEFSTLFDSMQCSTVMASLDTLAIATTLAGDAAGMKQGNQDAGKVIGDLEMVLTAANAAFTVADSIDTVNGIYGLTTNTAGLAKATSIIFLFWQIPTYSAGIVKAGIAIAGNAVNVVRGVVSTFVEGFYGKAYYDLIRDAKALPVWTDSIKVLQAADQKGVNDD